MNDGDVWPRRKLFDGRVRGVQDMQSFELPDGSFGVRVVTVLNDELDQDRILP